MKSSFEHKACKFGGSSLTWTDKTQSKCRLQEHLYKLKLTFTPCCICLREDESPYHYLFSCPLHAHSRALYNPVGYNWENIAQFVSHSGRKP